MGLAGKRAGRAVAPIPSASWVTEITPTPGGGTSEPLRLVARLRAGNAARHDAQGPTGIGAAEGCADGAPVLGLGPAGKPV